MITMLAENVKEEEDEETQIQGSKTVIVPRGNTKTQEIAANRPAPQVEADLAGVPREVGLPVLQEEQEDLQLEVTLRGGLPEVGEAVEEAAEEETALHARKESHRRESTTDQRATNG